jgi:catechol 2,3-dioxygenase-like lactoylglutathione lyase family enzyme
MTAWLGQYCINVADLDAAVAGYEALGLECTSRTEIPDAFEAVIENPAGGSKMQLAQQKQRPFALGNALWKLYVDTHDLADTFPRALGAGWTVVSEPQRLERWPVTVAFLHDLDGYLVELVERHPWPDDKPKDGPWMGQFCINVTDLEATIAFYELLGLTCTSRTEIPDAFEAILENPEKGSKVQLAQQKAQDGPIDMGTAMWKLYVNTDDIGGLYDAALGTGFTSVQAPERYDRWPVSVGFVGDPDGYQVELVQRHPW